MDNPSDKIRPGFSWQVRGALAILLDSAYLETHPLTDILPQADISGEVTKAQPLRALLKNSLEALRQPTDTPPSAPEWRSYQALQQRYIQGFPLLIVQQNLGVSERQLQREINNGMEMP